jgi:hypothetical protein
MPVTRVFFPLDAQSFEALAEAGGWLPGVAHAVTPRLGRPGLVVDEEELEHTAWCAAVADASPLTPGGLRIVAAADIDSSSVVPARAADQVTLVEVTGPVERRRVVSFHVDERPGATGADDLLWYDVTEIDEVRELVTRG